MTTFTFKILSKRTPTLVTSLLALDAGVDAVGVDCTAVLVAAIPAKELL